MRSLKLAAVIAAASLAASCGLAPPMTTYTYPNYGFSVRFPAAPTVDETTDPRSGVHLTALDSQSLGRDFAITFTAADPTLDIDELVDGASTAMAKMVGGEVTYRTTCATAEGVLGRELVISKNGRRAVRARYYLSGARFYVLTAESAVAVPLARPTDVDPNGPGTDDDPAVTHFLTSFHVMPTTKS